MVKPKKAAVRETVKTLNVFAIRHNQSKMVKNAQGYNGFGQGLGLLVTVLDLSEPAMVMFHKALPREQTPNISGGKGSGRG